MKVKKTQVILFMYEKFLFDRVLDPILIKEKFEIEDKTFYRYIQELRAYYFNMFKNEKIIYSKRNKVYILK